MFFHKKKTNAPQPAVVKINGKLYPAIIRKKNKKEQIWHPKDQKWVHWSPDLEN